MSYKKGYYILILLFVLFSCAKEGKKIYVEGKVINPVTGEEIQQHTYWSIDLINLR